MNSDRTQIRFQRKRSPVLPEHRPLYKIGQLLLILSLASRAGKSSLARLHLFNWALKKRDRYERLLEATKTRKLYVRAWGFDPSVAISLRLAAAQDLVAASANGYELTEVGQAFVEKINGDASLFVTEKEMLRRLGRGVTEGMVTDVARGWSQ